MVLIFWYGKYMYSEVEWYLLKATYDNFCISHMLVDCFGILPQNPKVIHFFPLKKKTVGYMYKIFLDALEWLKDFSY